MLCQFTVKNYRSIRDEITFDMQAAAIHEHSDRIIRASDRQEFLPISAIYGPNGGGKSNVLDAIWALTALVLRPIHAAGHGPLREKLLADVTIRPFAFSEKQKNDPTEFEIFFRTSQAEYRYILTISEDTVLYEKLDRIKLDTGRPSALFERDRNNVQLKGVLKKLRISSDLSFGLPLLSYLGIMYANNDVIKDAVSWFTDKICFLNYDNPWVELHTAIASSDSMKQLILIMIREMNLEIDDFRVEEHDDASIEIYTKHVIGDHEYELTLEEESSGTRKVFGMLPYILKSIVRGTTLIVDELDAKVHPQLLKHIIDLYADMTVNQHGAQLIFSSHDLSTMSSEIFRRDEIWFVAKGKDQNSMLYSLVEFKTPNGEIVRADARYDKQYLEGKYGADPYLQRIIDWEVVHGEKAEV